MENTISNGVIRAAGGLVWRDGDRGREVVVVHRPRYDDWTLPKGKLKSRETWEAAAKREIEEETGFQVRISGFAGCVCYTVDGHPKVVLFWNVVPIEPYAFRPSEEVDELRWLPYQEALELLEYEGERRILVNNSGV